MVHGVSFMVVEDGVEEGENIGIFLFPKVGEARRAKRGIEGGRGMW